jgi:tetratricopeptide (TPR) repeat protein
MGVLSWLRARAIRKQAGEAVQQGRLKEAAVAFEGLVEIRPSDWQAWCGLGECHYDLGDLDAAERAFNRCLDLNRESIEAAEGKALIWAERDRDWTRSLQTLEATLEQTAKAGVPEFTELSIAWVHHLRGNAERARQYLDTALTHMSSWQSLGVERDAQFASVEYRLGVLRHSLSDDREQALEHLQCAARLSPESTFGRQAAALAEEIAGSRESAV